MGVFSLEPLKGLDHIQTAYVQKDNPIEVVLKEDGKEYDFSTATAIRVKIGNIVIDSETEADAFDRSDFHWWPDHRGEGLQCEGRN